MNKEDRENRVGEDGEAEDGGEGGVVGDIGDVKSTEGISEVEGEEILRNESENISGRSNGPPKSSYTRGSRFGMRGRGRPAARRGFSYSRGSQSYSRGPPAYSRGSSGYSRDPPAAYPRVSSPSFQQSSSTNTRVYVGNLPWQVSWQDLKDHMRLCGNVLHAEILKDEIGRSKGCGIVEYNTPEEAEAAKRTLNDSKIGDIERLIFVREDREPSRDLGESGRICGRQIFIRNLPFNTHWRDLKYHFQQCGRIIRADTLFGEDGRPKGQGTILFDSKSDAQKAIDTFNDTEFQGRIISVHEDKFV